MTGRAWLLLVSVLALLATAGCSRGAPDSRLVLDGRARVPDQEGVVMSVSRTRVTLDGGRTYRVSPKLQSFATQTMQAVAFLGREGQYVHIGVDGDTVVWFATVADVVPGKPPVAYYTGVLQKVRGRSAYFRDGTVLKLADNVSVPATSGFMQVEIDPSSHLVRHLALP